MAAESVTLMLRKWSSGDKAVLDVLMPLVYAELKKIAEGYMARERPSPTFSATDLVAEAYERLVVDDQPQWNDRVHFFAVAARHMRPILVDRARRRCAAKRGGGARPIPLDEQTIADDRPEDMIALDDALVTLADLDERKARALEMHYFAGMTQDEIATALDVHVSTVARELRLAIAWLNQQLAVR
jgi:RNA polymerase sigma factor (TIGR02999 family)